MGENWDDSTQSKEQIEASLISRQEAAIRRERALAYAFSHQVGIPALRTYANLYIYLILAIRRKMSRNVFFTVEEYFKICQPNVCRPKQLAVGLELVGALDGSKTLGGP
jgi:hypothetical protein